MVEVVEETTLETLQNETSVTANATDLLHQYRDMDIENLQTLLTSEKISKNQKKKIAKQVKWLESADARKEYRKKRKLRYKEMRAANTNEEYVKRKKHENISTTEDFDKLLHIAIDLSFDRLMTNRDVRKLGKQIGWCYKENRRSLNPFQYHLCGLEGRLKGSLDPSHVNWDVHFNTNIFESFPLESIVYLTAESPNCLTEMEPGKVYVIGGLVDHNHEKGICQKIAEEKKVTTARLPLQENIDIKTRKVLTVNHVFEILLAHQETQDWKSAILKVLPPKKLISEKPGLANDAVKEGSKSVEQDTCSNCDKNVKSPVSPNVDFKGDCSASPLNGDKRESNITMTSNNIETEEA